MKYFGDLLYPITGTEETEELLQTLHPRFLFVKRLKRNARLLDFGAGQGSIVHYKNWLKPLRTDLKMFAYSLEKGEYFDLYDGYELGKWPGFRPFDTRTFDGIFCSHFIEHITDHEEFIGWCYSHLSAGGQMYLEFPSEFSVDSPTNTDLSCDGINVFIGNFYDDPTHLELPSWKSLSVAAESAGFFIQEQGIVKIPFSENEIPAQDAFSQDKFAMQMAYWSKSNWSRYAILTRPF